MTFETFDQSDEEAYPEADQKNNEMTNTKAKTKTMTKTFRECPQRVILETYDL